MQFALDFWHAFAADGAEFAADEIGRKTGAQQAAILRLKQLENSADHHHELIALTDALTALKILAETTWADLR